MEIEVSLTVNYNCFFTCSLERSWGDEGAEPWALNVTRWIELKFVIDNSREINYGARLYSLNWVIKVRYWKFAEWSFSHPWIGNWNKYIVCLSNEI